MGIMPTTEGILGENGAELKYFNSYLQISPFSHALWRSLEAQLISAIEMIPPIVDIGCGFGEFAGVFCEDMIEVGLDISPDNVTQAANGNKYNELIVADARALPFDDNSFNSALSVSVLEHIINPDSVFKEVFRVLSPGGNFVFTVNTSSLEDALVIPALLRKIGLRNLAKKYYDSFCAAFQIKTLLKTGEWVEFAKNAGFNISVVSGTMNRKQLLTYEVGLPTAFLSKISTLLMGRRLPFQSTLRVKTLDFIGTRLLNLSLPKKTTDANVLVIAEKPS